jgi:hypothetical protein
VPTLFRHNRTGPEPQARRIRCWIWCSLDMAAGEWCWQSTEGYATSRNASNVIPSARTGLP